MIEVKNRTLGTIMVICALALGAGGIFAVNAITPVKTQNSVIYFIAGTAVMAAAAFAGKKNLLKAAPYFMALELVLLICTLFCRPVNGACRWLRIGSFAIAPALMSLPLLALFWGYMFDFCKDKFSRKHLLILCGVTLGTAALVFFEPYTALAVFIIILAVVMSYCTGINRRKFTAVVISGAAVCILALAAAVRLNANSPLGRFFSNMFVPEMQQNYHTFCMLKILKNSHFFGKAPGKYYLPDNISNSMLAAGCGESGYWFMLTAIGLMTILLVCAVMLTLRCKERSDRMISAGMTASLLLPALVNVLMTTALLPAGAVAFPFISYGASLMAGNFLATGCILAVSGYCRGNFKTPQKS